MDRARRAGNAALVGIVALVVLFVASGGPGRSSATTDRVALAAAVGWPTSSGLVVAEIVTGGASASDEWIEIANAAAAPLDLAGLELSYVTSSGATVTRKASWTASLVLEPGRHLLLANAAGIHAAIADATYSGGLAATGGALVLRPIGGEPTDAVGWGDAANAFVEAVAAPAPAAGSSIERRPGGLLGHATDSNDNSADFAVNPLPVAQNLASPPTPGPSPSPAVPPSPSIAPSPSPDPSPSPSPEPTPTPTPEPSPSPTPTPTPDPSPDPTPSPTPEPSPSPSPEPTPTPTPEPSVEPSPSPSPAPTITAIGNARLLPDGTSVAVEGVLTTVLGSLESGRTGFVQDVTGGIALYLDAAVPTPLAAGTIVRVAGSLDERYGQRTLRTAIGDVTVLGSSELPAPFVRHTGGLGEPDEGSRVVIFGEIVDSPDPLADGLGLTVDDGSGPARVIVTPDAMAGQTPGRGDRISVEGPLGQRDSSGTGIEGYRVLATLPGESTILATPSPSPSPSPDPSPRPSPSSSPDPSPSPSPAPSTEPSTSPSPWPTPTPSPSPSPDPSPDPTMMIAVARIQPVGTEVRIRGVVTTESGRLGKPPLLAVEDASAGIVVHLPDDASEPERGDLIEVVGRTAAPYGQLELRPGQGGVVRLGRGDLPTPLSISAADLGEGLESRLVVLEATVTAAPRRAASGDLTIDVTDRAGIDARIMVDASAGIARESFVKGVAYTFTGIVGQRASRTGALDGYRIWLRDSGDLVPVASPSPSPSPSPGSSPSPGPSSGPGATASPSPGASSGPGPAFLSIAGALATSDLVVGIEAAVTAAPTLLDGSGRRIVVQDATGAVEVLLPDARPLAVGDRVRAVGAMGVAYGAPRFRATEVSLIGRVSPPEPMDLGGSPAAAHEWRLARVRGTVVDVQRMGDRWRAEVQVGTDRVLVTGLPGAGIGADRLPEGSTATVVGIVRRPYPSAVDRRFALAPRSTSDILVATTGSAGGSPTPVSGSSSGGTTSGGSVHVGGAAGAGSGSTGDPGGTSDGGATADGVPRIDLAQLGEFRDRTVQVGGLVAEVGADGVLLDDGTARAWLTLGAAAAGLLADLIVGDAVLATGTVTGEPGAEHVLLEDPADIMLAAGSARIAARFGEGRTDDVGGTGAPAEAIATTGADGGETSGPGADPPVVAGTVGLLALLVLAGVAGMLAGRRWLDRRRLAARIGARLASIVGAAGGPDTPPGAVPSTSGATPAGGPLTVAPPGAS